MAVLLNKIIIAKITITLIEVSKVRRRMPEYA